MDYFNYNHLKSPAAEQAQTINPPAPCFTAGVRDVLGWFAPSIALGIMAAAATPLHHGLMNQGATCYLNSVLQVLFMTKEFREAVNSFTDENSETTDKVIDRDLKDLFEDLLHRTTYTYKITKALKIDRVYEQRDAAEYLEKILGLSSPNAAKIFHGQMVHRTTCSKCENVTDTDGLFWHLPFELVDSFSGNYSVVGGIEEYFKPSYFHGDNQMYCDTCDGKVDASSKYVIKHHPYVLILLLKRFDFSYRYMSYVKIKCDVDVPYTLKIPENQTYELYAVVDHSGDVRGGHYSATIKTQDGEDKWFCFNDTTVAALSSSPFTDKRSIARFPNAYLLFYRKKADIQAKGSKRITSSANENAENEPKPKKSKQERGNVGICTRCKTGRPTKTKVDKPDVDPDVQPGDSKKPAALPGHERQGDMNDPPGGVTDEGAAGARLKDKKEKSDLFENNMTVNHKEADDKEEKLSNEGQNKMKTSHVFSKISVVHDKQAKKRDHQEEFVNGETEGMGEKHEAENADVYGQNMTLHKNHQENCEPSRPTVVDQTAPDVSQDFKSEDREKNVSAALEGQDNLCDSQQRLSDGATDRNQEEQEVKHQTENYDSYKQRITSTDRNTGDQEENRSMSSTGDQTDVENHEKVYLSENIQTIPDARLDSKLGGSERTPLPAVHDEMDPAHRRPNNVATDEKEQTGTTQNSHELGMKSKDENMKPDVDQDVKPGEEETSAGHDREDDVRDPSARFIHEETKGARTEQEKSDSSTKDTTRTDTQARDQEGNLSDEVQEEIQASPVLSQTPVGWKRRDKTSGPQVEFINVETEGMKIKHEAENADYYDRNSTSNNNNQEKDKHKLLSKDQHEVKDPENVGLTEAAEKKPDVNPERGDGETSAVSAACDRQGEESDTKVAKTNEKTENEKIKHEIEMSNTRSEILKSSGDEEENGDVSTIGATKVTDPKRSNLTKTKEMKVRMIYVSFASPEVHVVEQDYVHRIPVMEPDVNCKNCETSAACGSQTDMSEPHKLTGRRTTDTIHQTETSDFHENLEKDRSLLSTGELNKNKDPEKSEATGANPDVHPDVKHVDSKTTTVVVYKKDTNNEGKSLIPEKPSNPEEKKPSIQPEAVSSGRPEQNHRVKDDDNDDGDDDEVSNHLLTTEIQVEKVVDGSGAEGTLCTRRLKRNVLMVVVAVLVALCILIVVLNALL